MNATEFASRFLKEMEDVDHLDSLGNPTWTEAVMGVLLKIGEAAGYKVRSGLCISEYMGIDTAYFSPKDEHCTSYHGEELYWHPLVFIEHENNPKFGLSTGAAGGDFHKVCLYAVPLRVFIGYGKDHDEAAEELGRKLMEHYRKVGLRQLPNGETLLIMSKKPRDDKDDRWFMWLCEGEQDWQKISPSGC